MKIFNRFIKYLFWFYYLIKYTKIWQIDSQNEDSKYIVWIPIFSYRYFFSSRLLNDFGNITALTKSRIPYKILTRKKIGNLKDKFIFLSIGRDYNSYGFQNYTIELQLIIKELESQGNIVSPNLHEYLFWENKIQMHEVFIKENISHPLTKIMKLNNKVGNAEPPIEFPFLVKEVHSAGGVGIHKVLNIDDWELIKGKFSEQEIICQKLLNMRKDLRIIFVGKKIVAYYWRINNFDFWKPTSTDQGSSVDFEFFPEQWRDFLIDEFLKLKLTTGAFDVAWENDDLNSMPLILEVSPNYQLNPKINDPNNLANYGRFKKNSFFGKENYLEEYIKQTFSIIEKVVRAKV